MRSPARIFKQLFQPSPQYARVGQDEALMAEEYDERSLSIEDKPVTTARRRRVGWCTARRHVLALAGFIVVCLVLYFHVIPRYSTPSPPEWSRPADRYKPTLRPPVRLHWVNAGYGENNRPPTLPPDCPIPVLFTGDDNADAIIYSSDFGAASSWNSNDRPWQAHVISGLEAGPQREPLYNHHKLLKEGRRNETYEIEMTYRLDSDIPRVYAYGFMNFSTPALPYIEKRKDKIAAAFISNCNPLNARTAVLQELMSLLPGKIDSYGPCANNANTEEEFKKMGIWDVDGGVNSATSNWDRKMKMIERYKFTIAFENSNDDDYVTEKYFQPMEKGSVPLHMGSPTFNASFLPTPNAAIDLAHYLSPAVMSPSVPFNYANTPFDDESKEGLQRLGVRLEHLASEQGRREYESMLAWKNDERWRTESPFGKVVGYAKRNQSEECRLAGVLRGIYDIESGWKDGFY